MVRLHQGRRADGLCPDWVTHPAGQSRSGNEPNRTKLPAQNWITGWLRGPVPNTDRHLLESAHRATVILSEASYAISLISSDPTISSQSPHVYLPCSLSGLMVDFRNLGMCFTDCHSTCSFRNIHTSNEIRQYSLHCIPILNHQTNSYHTHEQLHVLIVDYQFRIPPCGIRCFPISTLGCVDPVHLYGKDHSLYLLWNTFPLFE